MWELALLILCEGLAGSALAFSLRIGQHTERAESQSKCVTGWTIFIIICTLLGYGIMKASIPGV